MPAASISFLILMLLAIQAFSDSPQWQSCSGLCYPCAKLMIFKNCLMWTPSYLLLCTPKPLPSVLPSSPFLHQSFQLPMAARNAHNFWVTPSQFGEKVILISWKLNTFLCKQSKTENANITRKFSPGQYSHSGD